MTGSEILAEIASYLERHRIRYMLVGSFASSFYGTIRATRDMDFVIEATPDQLKDLVANLLADGYYAELDAALEAHKRESMFNVLATTGWKIDFIFRKSRAFDREEFERRISARLSDVQLFVASAEDVVISKLEWAKLGSSQRHIEDVAKVLSIRWRTPDQNYLARWIGELHLQEQWSAAKQAAEITD